MTLSPLSTDAAPRPRIHLTLDLPEALAMFRARRESLRGKADAESVLRVERLAVAIERLDERLADHNALQVTEHSADSSEVSAVSTDDSKQPPAQ